MSNLKAVKGNFNQKSTKPLKTNRFSVNTTSLTPNVTKINDVNEGVLITPTVYFTPEVYKKMQFIVEYCKKEVGWMGLVNDLGNNVYVIDKIYVPEQTVSSSETDIDSEAMAKLALQILDDNDDPSRMYAWFHSHVNMAVSPSVQDEHQVAEFIENCPIFIRGIMNKRNDLKVDVYYRDYNVAYNCVKTNVWTDPLSKETLTELQNVINKNVTEQTYNYPTFNKNIGYPVKSFSSQTSTKKDISTFYDDNSYQDSIDELIQYQEDNVDYYYTETEWDDRVGISCTKYEKIILDSFSDQEIMSAIEENPFFPFDSSGNFIADEKLDEDNYYNM